MEIIVNGKTKDVRSPCTVDELLRECASGSAACAVEVNEQIVPKRDHASRLLEAGDRVEIVTLVGGG